MGKSKTVSYTHLIEKDIEERDYRDMHRENSPLRQAEDAVLLDSSHTVSYTHLEPPMPLTIFKSPFDTPPSNRLLRFPL